MSLYDYTPENDAALAVSLDELLKRIELRIGVIGENTDAELLDAMCLLQSYHHELIMRRQDARGMWCLIESFQRGACP